MIVISCTHETKVRCGKDRKGNQRFKCNECGKYLVEETDRPLGTMRITLKQASTALGMILEGMSIRATERLTGLHRDTIDDLILLVGENCQRLLDGIRGVAVDDVQMDEIWSFVGMKEKRRMARGESEEFGDSWTWIAVERNTKMVLAHHVGQRDSASCWSFLQKLNRTVVGRFQVSTDGLRAYSLNVPFMFGSRVDFGQLIKVYASSQTTTRYSPATIISSEKQAIFGTPDHNRICTSHIERLNLTLRMNMRRFTRLTNGHSKSLKHHVAMQAIFFAHYNFCRKHEAIKGATPAMASGLADKIWSIRELLENAANC